MRSVKTTVLLALVLCFVACSKPQVRMSFEGFTNDTIVVFSIPVDLLTSATNGSDQTIDTLLIKDGYIEIPSREEPMCYSFLFKETDDNSRNFSRRSISTITTPKDRLIFEVKRTEEQFEYTAKGSDYAEGVADYDKFIRPISHTIDQIDRSQEDNWDELKALYDTRRAQAAEWLQNNLHNPAALYVLAYEVSFETFLDYYDDLLPMINTSVIGPLLEVMKEMVDIEMMTKSAQERIKEGAEAPLFTLPDNLGNDVSLSSFRGKWVVLDFWGTWCGYCINGIPAMKEAYEKHKGDCEFISIDCNDSRERWLEGLAEHQMPWVHLYNSNDAAPEQNVSVTYAVQGFPTKILITPNGLIHKIFVGETQDFYKELDKVL